MVDGFAGWSRISTRCHVFTSLNATIECGKTFSLSKRSRGDEDENLRSIRIGEKA